MTTVSPTSSVTSSSTNSSSSSSSATTGTNSLSYNDFLTLLLAEMKNQDPTSPMDATQEVSQLATISEVGQAVQTNTTLSSLLTTSALTQSELAVGGSVTSADGKTSGTVQSVSVDSSGAATATLTNGDTVTYANGAVVK
jgi:flagellar basal-body rod modification protein FlgD